MQITPIGLLLIPLGLVWTFISPRKLYLATLFFAPFSATAVLNLGSGESASGLQVYVLFSFLLIARQCFDAVVDAGIRISQTIRRPLLLMFGFITICAISIVMPLWIDGRLQIMSPVLLYMTTTPLRFTSANITGVIYLLLGAGSTMIIARRTIAPQEFRLALKCYGLSGAFVACWGIFQAACHVVRIPYPAFIFNTSATPSAQGFSSVLENSGLQRVSSVAVEPSLFAASLLTIFPLSLVVFIGGGTIVSRRLDKVIFVAMAIALLLSTSSTAFIGLATLAMLCIRYLFRFRSIRVKYLMVTLVAVVIALVGYVALSPIQTLIQSALLSKSEGYSALERTKTVVYAFQYFLDYPWLGVGWASVTSHDTIVKLLSNCGVIGLAAFVWFIWSIVQPLRKRISELDVLSRARAFSSPALIILIILIIMLVVAVIDGFPYVFGHFWVVLGLGISAGVISRKHPYLLRDAEAS